MQKKWRVGRQNGDLLYLSVWILPFWIERERGCDEKVKDRILERESLRARRTVQNTRHGRCPFYLFIINSVLC